MKYLLQMQEHQHTSKIAIKHTFYQNTKQTSSANRRSILKFFLIPITSVFSEVSTLVFLIRGAVQWEMADHWVDNWHQRLL
jgi:hypothetical protein